MKLRTPVQDQCLIFFNQFLYDALAPVYNSLDWLTLGVWWRLVGRSLDYVPENHEILEVGFGPGKLHVELARRAAFCTGVDLAAGMCRHTHKKLELAGLPPHIVRGNVYHLPYPDDAFDDVVCTFAFSGFPGGDHALGEMVRVLRPNGHLVMVDIGLPTDGNRLGTFWARLWEQMGDYLYDLPALFVAAGLQVTTCVEYGPGRHIRVIVGEKAGD